MPPRTRTELLRERVAELRRAYKPPGHWEDPQVHLATYQEAISCVDKEASREIEQESKLQAAKKRPARPFSAHVVHSTKYLPADQRTQRPLITSISRLPYPGLSPSKLKARPQTGGQRRNWRRNNRWTGNKIYYANSKERSSIAPDGPTFSEGSMYDSMNHAMYSSFSHDGVFRPPDYSRVSSPPKRFAQIPVPTFDTTLQMGGFRDVSESKQPAASRRSSIGSEASSVAPSDSDLHAHQAAHRRPQTAIRRPAAGKRVRMARPGTAGALTGARGARATRRPVSAFLRLYASQTVSSRGAVTDPNNIIRQAWKSLGGQSVDKDGDGSGVDSHHTPTDCVETDAAPADARPLLSNFDEQFFSTFNGRMFRKAFKQQHSHHRRGITVGGKLSVQRNRHVTRDSGFGTKIHINRNSLAMQRLLQPSRHTRSRTYAAGGKQSAGMSLRERYRMHRGSMDAEASTWDADEPEGPSLAEKVLRMTSASPSLLSPNSPHNQWQGDSDDMETGSKQDDYAEDEGEGPETPRLPETRIHESVDTHGQAVSADQFQAPVRAQSGRLRWGAAAPTPV